MALEFRRGKEAIAEANRSSERSFSPFLSNFYWKDDKQSRLLWILNPIDDIPLVKVIKPYTTDERVEYVIARQDKCHGENADPIEDKWGYGPAENNVCVAVELNATMEIRNGRERPSGFEVVTREFTRRVRDDNGELTDQKEEAVSPSVGIICQSYKNFFNHLSHKDSTVGPINQFPLQIVRNGDGTDTDYEIDLFENQPLDMSGLLENWEDISYLTEEEKDDVAEMIEQADDDEEIVSIIGAALLDKWLNEHAADEWYATVSGKINAHAKWPSKKYQEANGKGEKTKTAEPRERAARTSSRRSRREPEAEAVETETTETTEEAPAEVEVEATPEEPKAKRTRRKAAKAEETPAEVEEEVTKDSPITERMKKLRAQTIASSREAA
jgi:hypothetical protein